MKQFNIDKYAVADNLLLFVMAYQPYVYPGDCYTIDAYYVASNLMYKTQYKIIDELKKYNVAATIYKGSNVKALAAKYLGATIGINTLSYIEGIGSFYTIGAIALGEVEQIKVHAEPTCNKCNKCVAVCPTGAISAEGFTQSRCIRYVQEHSDSGAPIDCGDSLLGCNLCQLVCPFNSSICKIQAPQQLATILNKTNIDNLATAESRKILAATMGANYARTSFVTRLIDRVKISRDR